MVNNHQQTWSTIIKTHGQTSSQNMFKHHQNTWSVIIKNMVEHRQAHGQTGGGLLYWELFLTELQNRSRQVSTNYAEIRGSRTPDVADI
jgi:hypothetical protein